MTGLPWPVACAVAVTVAASAWLARSLSTGGALAATLLGALLLGTGAWAWGAPLFVAFVSCSLLSCRERRRVDGDPERSRRSAVQVLANGGVGLPLVALQWILPHPAWTLGWWACCAALAADTWATEVGGRWGGRPRRLLLGGPLATGSSGGMTPLGTAAGCLGALAIALVCLPWSDGRTSTVIAICGVSGMWADSLLGCLQGRWRCPRCGHLGEQRRHCAVPGTHSVGSPLLDNDTVNLLATGIASALGCLAALGLRD